MKITVNASKKYDVIIERGILSDSGELIGRIHKPCRALLVSDDRVYSLYGKAVKASLENSGFAIESFVFAYGESSKNTYNFIEISELAAERGFSRSDIFVYLGGGVTGDLCGFAAACYMRGIEFFGIPTSFLAAVDSSVGGKTAVDLAGGKNLLGAFCQPSGVICDPDCFQTLDKTTFSDGTAEALKTGVIRSENLFELLSEDFSEKITEVTAECVRIKKEVVEADEFDRGERAILNFGHTIGHAIEKLSSYRVSHGHAVAIGMSLITDAAERHGLCELGTAVRLKAALEKNALPCACEYTIEELAAAAYSDKKRTGNKLSLILPERIGKAYIYDIESDRFADFLG